MAKTIDIPSVAHVNEGDPLVISAGDWNLMGSAANAHEARRFNQLVDAAQNMQQTGIVLIKNSSRSDLVIGEVLAIESDAPLLKVNNSALNEDDLKRRITLRGREPNREEVSRGKFVVLMEPLAKNAVGRACISGVCVAKVDFRHDGHQYADVTENVTGNLLSDQCGSAQIIWSNPAVSPFSIVRLGIPTLERDFELKTALGLSASAYMVDKDGVADEDARSTFTVYSQITTGIKGLFEGRARDTFVGPGVERGSFGRARWTEHTSDNQSAPKGRWDVIAMQPRFQTMIGTLNGALAAADTSFIPATLSYVSPLGAVAIEPDAFSGPTVVNRSPGLEGEFERAEQQRLHSRHPPDDYDFNQGRIPACFGGPAPWAALDGRDNLLLPVGQGEHCRPPGAGGD